MLARLYNLGNQLLQGGATYKSKLNKLKAEVASSSFKFPVTVIIDILIENDCSGQKADTAETIATILAENSFLKHLKARYISKFGNA